jgi:hypothetical protein
MRRKDLFHLVTFPLPLTSRLRVVDAAAPQGDCADTDSEFALSGRVIICAVLTSLSAFRPSFPHGSRPLRCGCADHHEVKLIAAANR